MPGFPATVATTHVSALVAGDVARQTEGMREVRPAANPDAAQWLLRSDVDWWDLVRYGPPGFDVYVRISFPENQAWCLACDVDEEIEFTVGCSGEASQALARDLPGAVRRVHFGEAAPVYRDPA